MVLTFTNLAAVGAWAVSRTVGLGVEPIAVAGVATVVLELAAIAVVMASLGTVAIAAPAVGPAHDDRHGHEGTETTDRPEVVQLGPGDFEAIPT